MLALHAAAEKGNPARLRVFEMYADESAYQAHLRTPHFQRFRSGTAKMVLARRMYDAVPILLGAKPRLPAKALVRIAELDVTKSMITARRLFETEPLSLSAKPR